MRQRLRPTLPLAVLAGALLAAAPRAHAADSWLPIGFTSPAGKPAHGIATDSVRAPEARLVIGCEDGVNDAGDGWRGVAVSRSLEPASTETDASVTISFFGRAPVVERWQVRADGPGKQLLWPPSAESLRRNLLREDATRGNAVVTFEVREGDGVVVQLVFALAGLVQRSADVAAVCGGWGAAPRDDRRERSW